MHIRRDNKARLKSFSSRGILSGMTTLWLKLKRCHHFYIWASSLLGDLICTLINKQSSASYRIFQLLRWSIWIEGTCARFLDLICIWLNIDRHLCGLFSWLPGGFKRNMAVGLSEICWWICFLYSLHMMLRWNQIMPPLGLRSIKIILANSTQLQTIFCKYTLQAPHFEV